MPFWQLLGAVTILVGIYLGLLMNNDSKDDANGESRALGCFFSMGFAAFFVFLGLIFLIVGLF